MFYLLLYYKLYLNPKLYLFFYFFILARAGKGYNPFFGFLLLNPLLGNFPSLLSLLTIVTRVESHGKFKNFYQKKKLRESSSKMTCSGDSCQRINYLSLWRDFPSLPVSLELEVGRDIYFPLGHRQQHTH